MPRPRALPERYRVPHPFTPPYPGAVWVDPVTLTAATTARPTPERPDRVRVAWRDGRDRSAVLPTASGLDPRPLAPGGVGDGHRSAVWVAFPAALEVWEEDAPAGASWRAWRVILARGYWAGTPPE